MGELDKCRAELFQRCRTCPEACDKEDLVLGGLEGWEDCGRVYFKRTANGEVCEGGLGCFEQSRGVIAPEMSLVLLNASCCSQAIQAFQGQHRVVMQQELMVSVLMLTSNLWILRIIGLRRPLLHCIRSQPARDVAVCLCQDVTRT